jgi:cell division protein FtsW
MQFNGVTINGATRWVDIFGIRFQPSEIAKLSLIIVVADFMSRIKDNDPVSEKTWFRYIMITTGVFCLIIFKDNISTAILIFGVVFIMMFIGRISLKRLGIIALVGLIVCASGYGIGKAMLQLPSDSGVRSVAAFNRIPTMTARIDRFFAGEEDVNKFRFHPDGSDFQPKNALIAIARGGGVTGVGIGNSIQRDYLPYAYSDFIYAIALEEGGLILGIFLILLYIILLFRAGQIATKCNAVFPALLVFGLSLMIVTQAFISMAVVVGLGPVTGQPLPLISHGGTSIVITSIYFGIILGITKQIKESQQEQAEGTVVEIPVVELEEMNLENSEI